ncbi:ras-specific guanine nucleotide-releasing factor 2-like isoform X3 [Pogonomyrmex barbatus]|uniref:Ras-specific guanine nucleotide-releasing factor 2-like isoform X3 n=1 Tax=Pogonomyrmex barbatus TaxID=144034 RepID=A0A6I9WGM1_9HYME|nr:ras-specific guanine nucleotide-releasing factor 2-like isoform X3 [Pogonomyrmex barbatus]
MLSPKMQKTVRVNDSQLIMLSEKAHYDHSLSGYLYKRTADSTKWQQRWFVLYQNLLFYYENETCSRPSGVVLLEGCYCNRLITAKGKEPDKQHCFAISYRRENQRQYELKAATETDCKAWIDAIREASFNKLLLQKEELEQKHLHLLQIVESEKTAKWQYTQQCEDLASEIKKLRAELCALKKELRPSVVSMYTSRPAVQRTMSQGTGSLYNTFQPYGSSAHGSACFAPGLRDITEGSIEMQKVKKVQSFFRGWLCRRRWKQIVEQYIKSPHAESMRKRNSLVFQMVEAEEEYTEQMEILVSCFLRPFKMAASSKKPPCSHEDVNSIFLNSETVLFLHQIFLKGLTSRMESWPTLVLGDLFDMLLPMLSIYQEYVRNHHYSLQVLTECKQSSPFVALLNRLENKTACHGRSLETFLTYPMHQIPRYIITLHELLAHTPYDHVERKSLQNARQQLEDLSRQMHDEVSETENLRKNLAVERMIVEGCDILLDVNQVFVRQGTLIQLIDKPRGARSRLSATFGGKAASDKEAIRQCFLFSNHLLLTTRQSDDDGRLNLVPQIGKIPLSDAVLIEDPSDQSVTDDDGMSVCSMSSGISESSGSGSGSGTSQLQNRDFKIVLDIKSGGPQVTVHLVAPTIQEKAAWVSDISQCMDNVHFNDLLHGSLSDTSSVTMPQSIRNDPKLFKDDVDIRFSRTLNSCKIPQIRSATPERLLQRLTDLRFLSIDFLNTFLLTYRVFTDGVTVLEALKKVFYDAEPPDAQMPTGSLVSLDVLGANASESQSYSEDRRKSSISPRRTSGASSVSGYGSEVSDSRDAKSLDANASGYNSKSHWRSGYKKLEEEQPLGLISEAPVIKRSPTSQASSPSSSLQSPVMPRKISIRVDNKDENDDGCHLTIPKVIAVSSSSETLTDVTVMSAPSSPSNLSSVTLVGSTESGSGSGSGSDPSPQEGGTYSRRISEIDTPVTEENAKEVQFTYDDIPSSLQSAESTKADTPKTPKTPKTPRTPETPKTPRTSKTPDTPKTPKTPDVPNTPKTPDTPRTPKTPKTPKTPISPLRKEIKEYKEEATTSSNDDESVMSPKQQNQQQQYSEQHRASVASAPASTARSGSVSTITGNYWSNRRSMHDDISSQQSNFQHDAQVSSKAGVVITSFRQSHRRSSTSTAATAFAIATSASSNPPDKGPPTANDGNNRGRDKNRRKESVMSTAATMRVLNVLRHWVSKHAQDFEMDQNLKTMTIEFLEDINYSPNLLPAEHKAATQLLRLITKEETESNKVDLKKLLTPPAIPSKESIETLSALEIAEQMTYLDHHIFVSIASEEFLGQAWMKTDKATRAPHILLMTKRFNEVSQLVVSEIIRRSNMSARVAAIEKWAAVADINRVLHNYNGVLQICAAFTNSSVYRLKKTWDKVSKTTKQTIERLQHIVSSDGRFRNLRDALHRCDPPCIPYLGLYLTDLSFIEEGTPNVTEGLLNFSKMRMISHVIREIRHFQQTPYKIELVTKVTNYLLDTSLLLNEKDLYRMSLELEPRTSRLSSSALIDLPPSVSNVSTK